MSTILQIDDENSTNPNEPFKRTDSIFDFPRLPKWETCYYFLYVIIAAFWAVSTIYEASSNFVWTSEDTQYEDLQVPIFGTIRKDTNNYEWREWLPFLYKFVPALLVHSLLFNTLDKVLSQYVWKSVMALYWLAVYSWIHNIIQTVLTLAMGMVLFATMWATRRKPIVVVVGVCVFGAVLYPLYYLPYPINQNTTLVFCIYKFLQFMSFCIEECDAPRSENRDFLAGFFNMMWYALYLPYCCLLSIYKTFPSQLQKRPSKPRDWSSITRFGAKLVFGFLTIEIILRVLYFDAILNKPKLIQTIDSYVAMISAYASALFFAVKYVIIFGVPALFAKLDNMKPPERPSIFKRVQLYDKAWQYFDRGLYEFFKEYIFLPICRPTFSLGRKIIGINLSYIVVMLFYAFDTQSLAWCLMNVLELSIEISAKMIYTFPPVKRWRQQNISDKWFRRIIAFLLVFLWLVATSGGVIMALDTEVASAVFNRLVFGDLLTVFQRMLILIVTVYHLNQVSIEIETWMDRERFLILDLSDLRSI